MKTKEQILEEINKLEREKMEYLEVDNNSAARRKDKKIIELENELELSKLKEIKEDLELYKKFVSRKGLNSEFQRFMIIELARK